jgi:hypothetical protein
MTQDAEGGGALGVGIVLRKIDIAMLPARDAVPREQHAAKAGAQWQRLAPPTTQERLRR